MAIKPKPAYKGIPKQKSSSAAKPQRMSQTQKINYKLKPFVPHEVAQPPQTPLMLKGMSLKQLMRGSDPPREWRANNIVHITSIKKMATPKGLPAVAAVCWHEDLLRPNSVKAKRPHEVRVFGLDDPNAPISKQKRVLVSCDCEDWVFVWEYAVALRGASKVIYGNGQPPTRTNISCEPGLCKHLYAVAEQVLEKGW